MSKKTVMEMADDIMASMGMTDAVPLAEAPVEAVHSVGKRYDGDLPTLTDAQRASLIAESVTITEKKVKKDLEKPGEVTFKPLKGKKFEFEIATEPKKKETNKETQALVKKVFNRERNTWSPQAAIGQAITNQGDIAKLARLIGQTGKKPETTEDNRKPFAGLGEMTTVGALGVGPFGNKPAEDPDNPLKKKKRNITSNFIHKAFTK